MARPSSAAPLTAPRVPQAGKRRRDFIYDGRELRPLKGAEVPIPGDQDDDLLARWEAWRLRYNGSLPEFICWEWLVYRKRLIEGVDFIFQYGILGGRTQFGGFVLDFYFPSRRMAWLIQGLRWHLVKTQDRARDIMAKAILTGRGLTAIELFEDDLFNRSTYTLDHAWRGEQVSRRSA